VYDDQEEAEAAIAASQLLLEAYEQDVVDVTATVAENNLR